MHKHQTMKSLCWCQGASCDVWANRTASERYPALQGRGPQISDMSALRSDDQVEGKADDQAGAVPQPAAEPAEVRAPMSRCAGRPQTACSETGDDSVPGYLRPRTRMKPCIDAHPAQVLDHGLRCSVTQNMHSDLNSSSTLCSVRVQVSVSTLPQLEKLSFTLQHMVIFRMVARTGSIKDAAMALGLSAGAVSKSIAALEQAGLMIRHIAVSHQLACRIVTSIGSSPCV